MLVRVNADHVQGALLRRGFSMGPFYTMLSEQVANKCQVFMLSIKTYYCT